LVVGPISELVQRFQEARGEFTLLIPPMPPHPARKDSSPSADELSHELGHIIENGTKNRRAALRILAERHQLPVNELYRLLEHAENSGHKT
jgi:16S rRNA C1402 (ribose-2'-O) methylase RsmI